MAGKIQKVRNDSAAKVPTETGDRNLIPDDSIGTQKLKDLAVTEPKIGPDAITRTKIKNGEVTGEKNAIGFLLGTIQTFTSSGTWTKPVGVRAVKITVVGGGGGGAGGDGTAGQVSAGSGAGSGGTAINFITSGLGATEIITIGAGGIGVSNGSSGAGGNSTFGAHATGFGGNGLPSTTATTDDRPSNVIGSIGGTATGGNIANIQGGRGFDGMNFGVASAGRGGSGGNSTHGAGGSGGVEGGGGGGGIGFGGGAGGGAAVGATDRSGGNGSAGIIIVEEYY